MNSSENVPGQKVPRSSPSLVVTRIVPVMLALQVLLTLVIYPFLPNIVPSHWNAAGQIDSYEPKWLYAGFLPVFSLGLYVVLGALLVFSGPKSNSQDRLTQQKSEMAQMILKFVMLMQQGIFLITQPIILMIALHAGSGAVH